MIAFSDIVAASRDAQLRQSEREQADRAFVEDVMATVAEQVQAEGGDLRQEGEWTRRSENAYALYRLDFPGGCNVQAATLAVGGAVGGRAGRSRPQFMVGDSGRSAEPVEVKDRAEATQQVMGYLMDLVRETQRLHER